jgi:hypothetical protein
VVGTYDSIHMVVMVDNIYSNVHMMNSILCHMTSHVTNEPVVAHSRSAVGQTLYLHLQDLTGNEEADADRGDTDDPAGHLHHHEGHALEEPATKFVFNMHSRRDEIYPKRRQRRPLSLLDLFKGTVQPVLDFGFFYRTTISEPKIRILSNIAEQTEFEISKSQRGVKFFSSPFGRPYFSS